MATPIDSLSLKATLTGNELIALQDAQGGTTAEKTTTGALMPTASVANYGADPTGATDSSAAFIAAAAALNTYGGTVQIPPGVYEVQDLPISVNGGKPITWQGSGVEATTLQLPTTPTSAMFTSEALLSVRGGGTTGCTLYGDGSVPEPINPGDYDATQDCWDWTGLTADGFIFQYKVGNCFVRNFRRGWNSEARRDRDPVFSETDWWYNQTAIYIGKEHPMFSGTNDIRRNYIGIGGTIFDGLFYNVKMNYNHYGLKPVSIQSTRFQGGSIFGNYKAGLFIPSASTRNQFQDFLCVPPETLELQSITTAGNVLTVTTTDNHRLEDGDDIVLYDVTGITPDINETVYSVAVTNDTVFTVDIGEAASGTSADGRLCTSIADVRIGSSTNTFTAFFVRNGGNYSRNGMATFNIELGFANGISMMDCQWNWQNQTTPPTPLVRAFAFGGTEWRDSVISRNTTVNVSQMLKRDAGRVEQSIISGNNSLLDQCPGPGSGRSVWELNGSSSGNVIVANLVRENNNSPLAAGNYIYDIDATRSCVTGNYTRNSVANWSGSMRVIQADVDTVGVDNGTDTVVQKQNNPLTSF